MVKKAKEGDSPLWMRNDSERSPAVAEKPLIRRAQPMNSLLKRPAKLDEKEDNIATAAVRVVKM